MIACGKAVNIAGNSFPRNMGVVVSIARLNYGVRHSDGEVIYYPHASISVA